MNGTTELHVIFGTGPLGKWTARNLVQMGKQVRLINRSGTATGLPTGVEVVRGDAYDPASNAAQTRGATAIYQCAQPAYHQWEGNFPRMQAAILDAAVVNGAKLIVAENLYMYGDTHGQPIHEGMPLAAHTKKGKVRQAMTETLFAAHAAGKVPVAAIRGSDFFGPDDEISAGLTFRPALAGKRVNVLGSLDQPHTFTYTADFGKALAIAGTNEAALGQAWHVPSAPPITQRQFIALLREVIGKPVKTTVARPWLIHLLGLFNPTVGELYEMLYEFTQPFSMDSSKFERAFGMTATPQRQQLQEAVDWARNQICKANDVAPIVT
jgi:nucleoside-diphosphate-sugar epimerase